MFREALKSILEGGKVRGKLSRFQKEFREQLATFITGAFAFVAALLWRDAIRSYLDVYGDVIKEVMPIKETWVVQLVTALLVTVVAVIAVVIISRVLEPKD